MYLLYIDSYMTSELDLIDVVIVIVIVVVLLLVVICNAHTIYTSKNEYRHKNSDSLYAHFSMIDSYNYFIFPKLLFAHPVTYTLKEGQSLYIPKHWWHWVKTNKKTFAVNYWFGNTLKHDPFVFYHTIDFDINKLNDETVSVWKSDETNASYTQLFKDFYNSGIDNRYVVTLSNYEIGGKNGNIKHKMYDSIMFPNNDKIRLQTGSNYSYNIWISSNKHDTGLHYDDEDGVLTVVSGEKEVVLFPPSDSKYLYPYNNEYEWKNTGNALNFRYNSYSFIRNVQGVSSGELLYVTCNHDKRVLNNISKIYNRLNRERLVWGFKKMNCNNNNNNNNNDNHRWEIYNYTLHDEPVRITSMDVYPNKYSIGDEEHYYYKVNDGTPVQLPFWGYGKYKKNNMMYDESKIFVIDTYSSFYDNYDSYMVKLGYDEIKEQFRERILNKYHCYELCIHNKNPNQIFVQYLGISNKDFLDFLTTNSYPNPIIEFVKMHMSNGTYHINNEITIVYDIKTQSIVRTGFYGVI